MAGQMGNKRITVKNLSVVDVRPEQNILLIRGAIPGPNNSIIEIWKG
jgi:large subunit ribosomal protein L3